MNLFPYRDPCDLHNYYPLLYFIFMLVTLFPAREGRGNTRKSKLVLVFLYSPVLRLIKQGLYFVTVFGYINKYFYLLPKKKKKSKQTLWVRVYMDWFEKFSSLNLKCRSQLNAIDMTLG